VRNFLQTRKKDLDKYMELPASWNTWFQYDFNKEKKVSHSNIIEKNELAP
jgi:hypothetical protein